MAWYGYFEKKVSETCDMCTNANSDAHVIATSISDSIAGEESHCSKKCSKKYDS